MQTSALDQGGKSRNRSKGDTVRAVGALGSAFLADQLDGRDADRNVLRRRSIFPETAPEELVAANSTGPR